MTWALRRNIEWPYLYTWCYAWGWWQVRLGELNQKILGIIIFIFTDSMITHLWNTFNLRDGQKSPIKLAYGLKNLEWRVLDIAQQSSSVFEGKHTHFQKKDFLKKDNLYLKLDSHPIQICFFLLYVSWIKIRWATLDY